MKSQPQSSAQEVLAGLVERVTFHNTENGFCVLRAKVRGHRDLGGGAAHKQRWKEVDDGKVKMPKEPRMLYVMTGKGFDSATGTITDSYLRWVIYVPYATPESTGLTTKSGTEPWLMYPGTAGAHIMISPPKK